MKTTTMIGAAALACIAGLASGQSIQAFSSLGGPSTQAFGINDLGQVVGITTDTPFGAATATRWDGASNATLLGGADRTANSVAYAINNSGQIVGYSEYSDGLRTATLWSGGAARDIGAEMGASGSSIAWDINNNGTVAGQAALGPGFAKGFVWDNAGGGRTAGGSQFYMGGANYAINDSGALVGSGFFFGDPDDAFYSRPDGRGGYEDSDIAPPGYNYSVARDISNTGIVVGHTSYESPDGGFKAVIYNGRGDITRLGDIPNIENVEANAVNDHGMVVGYAWDNDFELLNTAWAYVDGEIYDLSEYIDGTDFARLYAATGVNNDGDIVGWGVLTDGTISGFRIEGFVPAPGAFTMLAMGVGVAARRRR